MQCNLLHVHFSKIMSTEVSIMIQNKHNKMNKCEMKIINTCQNNKIRAFKNDRAAYVDVRCRREVAPRSTSYALLPPYIPPWPIRRMPTEDLPFNFMLNIANPLTNKGTKRSET